MSLLLTVICASLPHWNRPAVELAVREGMLPETQGTLVGYRRTVDMLDTRYERAVMLWISLSRQTTRVEEALAGKGDAVERATLLRSSGLLPYYSGGAVEYRTEFKQLDMKVGETVARLRKLTAQLAERAQPRERAFSDVRFDHWAAKAVGELRALGMLDGYPDGVFRG